MGLDFFVILILLIIILYKQGEGLARQSAEMNAIKRRLDNLLASMEEKALSAGASCPERTEVIRKRESEEATARKDVEIGIEKQDDIIIPSVKVEEQMVEEVQVSTVKVLHTVPEVDRMEESVRPPVTDRLLVAEQPTEDRKQNGTDGAAPSAQEKKETVNYEEFIGGNLFGKIGILVLVLGVGFFVKYAIDKEWINETMRTILGFVTGTLLLFIAERMRKTYRAFSSLLAGGAFGVFYLTVAISFHYYHFFSQAVAFCILVFLTMLMSVVAVLYDRKEMAVLSLLGGFIAPFLVSNGEGNYVVLFTYLTVLNLGMFGLSLYKKWAELPLLSFVGTYLIWILYVADSILFTGYYDLESRRQAIHLFMFASVFYFIFLLPVISVLKAERKQLDKWLLYTIVTNNFVYLFLGLLFLERMQLPVKLSGAFTLFIGVVNLLLVLWLKRYKQRYAVVHSILLGLMLTFVSLTVPIQFEGNYITLFWASEMVLLLWLYIRSGIRTYELASLLLVLFTFISLVMDIYHHWSASYVRGMIFANGMFVTHIFTGLAMGVYAWLLMRYRDKLVNSRYLRESEWSVFALVLSVGTLFYAFLTEFHHYLPSEVSYRAMLLFTACYTLVLSYGFRKRFPIGQYCFLYMAGICINLAWYVLFVCGADYEQIGLVPTLLPWFTAVAMVINMVWVGGMYYSVHTHTSGFTAFLSVVSTILWMSVVHLFLGQCGLSDEYNAGFSVSLAMAGFVQMALGMCLHRKVLRVVSLVMFGMVLLKLIIVDLWAMPTVGKIVVFIMLGVILLVLSFLYQKLKDVLFGNDQE